MSSVTIESYIKAKKILTAMSRHRLHLAHLRLAAPFSVLVQVILDPASFLPPGLVLI